MKTTAKIAIGAAGTASLVLGARRWIEDRRMARLDRALASGEAAVAFNESLLEGLPDPAHRYFLHSIVPGTPLARSVRLRGSFRMTPRPGVDAIDMEAEEILAPPDGFVWTASFTMGPVSFRVRDHYFRGEGAVSVRTLGLVPVANAKGPDVARSSRHRLAADSIWLPSALLPSRGVEWQAVGDDCARVVLTIDDEAIGLTLGVDEVGRLREVSMERHGDVGVDAWQPLPYSFAVEEEKRFGGYTIPSRLCGGWWFGTDRHEASEASLIRLHDARFR